MSDLSILMSSLFREGNELPGRGKKTRLRVRQEATRAERSARRVQRGPDLRGLVQLRTTSLEGVSEHDSPGRDVLRGHARLEQETDLHLFLQAVGAYDRLRRSLKQLETSERPFEYPNHVPHEENH